MFSWKAFFKVGTTGIKFRGRDLARSFFTVVHFQSLLGAIRSEGFLRVGRNFDQESANLQIKSKHQFLKQCAWAEE